MTLLATYDGALAAIAAALQATAVDQVLAGRDHLEGVKARARRIRDRVLLADAIELQMKLERRLGELLLAAKDLGHLREGRPKKGAEDDAAAAPEPAERSEGVANGAEMRPATLAEIGVDRKLSMTAQRAAAMTPQTFAGAIADMRQRMASGKAILVDPVQSAAKNAVLDGIRAAHAARTMNGGTVKDLGNLALSGFRAKFIGSDPQWKFLTRSVAGDGRSANVHYKTEAVDKIKALPVGELAADHCLFGMWMVDWCPQDALDLGRHYGFEHVTTLYTWIKTNGDGALDLWRDSSWHMGQGYWTRANPEDCFLFTKGSPKRLDAGVRQLIVAPVMEHSRKPDEWLARSERLGEGPFLELQARRPRPGWVSWGDEMEFTGVAFEGVAA